MMFIIGQYHEKRNMNFSLRKSRLGIDNIRRVIKNIIYNLTSRAITNKSTAIPHILYFIFAQSNLRIHYDSQDCYYYWFSFFSIVENA